MELKYFLYIDILGFSDLVKEDPMKVRRLYNIIENLHCHKHDSFKTIVFSDTILVYNIDDYLWIEEKKYFIQYLIEFAHNLFNETIGKGYYFRAILLEDFFEHNQPNNIERYFGNALIRSYTDQKEINCMGLFIDKKVNEFNQFYPSKSFNENYNFVFLTLPLSNLIDDFGNYFPFEKEIIEDSDYPYELIKIINFFKELYTNIQKQKDERIKQKYLNTYRFYKEKYSKFILHLEKNNFNLDCVCKGINWKKYEIVLKNGIGGYDITPPTLERFKEIIEKARLEGETEVTKYCKRKYKTDGLNDIPFLPCGGAHIEFDIFPNSKLGRFLLNNKEKIDRVSINTTYKKRSISFSIFGMNNTQAKILDEVAHQAAFKILKEELGVEGYVSVYWD
jgi:hypothetical protein